MARPTYALITALIILSSTLSACKARDASSIPIAGLWNATVKNGQADWETASVLAQEERSGFELANQEAGFKVLDFAEGNRQDDVQAAVRKMVEGQAEATQVDPVLALLGATSNEGTARAAALSNFFNLPMLVPSASGDNLLPSNNLWAFRLSVPDSAYADYILGSVLTSQNLSDGQAADFTPNLRIAILYEQNTYGESAAVATATVALQQGLEVTAYDKFPAESPNASLLRTLVNSVIDQDPQVVFIVSSNPSVAQAIVKTFNTLLDPLAMPVLVGMAGGFTSLDFLESVRAEDVFVLRQRMDLAGCPPEIASLYAAQNYAALQLMSYAVEEAPNLAADRAKLSLKNGDGLAAYREAVRDALKAANLKLPCLGQVAFDNTGQNKFVNIEIVTAGNGTAHSLPADEFIATVKQKLGLGSSRQEQPED